MNIQFIRHATFILEINNKKLLVDPVLSPMGTMTPIENVPNQNNNPLVALPVPVESIIDCDAIIVTHTHRDHFDDKAAELLPKELPLFCQREDETKIRAFGFVNVIPVKDHFEWEGIHIIRTKGKHGHGVIAFKMAPVSGFVISASDEPSVYVMGDSVWCSYTEKALLKYAPEFVISNCGEAKFAYGRAITMNAPDILSICQKSPSVKVIAVHMEAWNHCRLSREALRDFTILHSIEKQVHIPADGELIIGQNTWLGNTIEEKTGQLRCYQHKSDLFFCNGIEKGEQKDIRIVEKRGAQLFNVDIFTKFGIYAMFTMKAHP